MIRMVVRIGLAAGLIHRLPHGQLGEATSRNIAPYVCALPETLPT